MAVTQPEQAKNSALAEKYHLAADTSKQRQSVPTLSFGEFPAQLSLFLSPFHHGLMALRMLPEMNITRLLVLRRPLV